MSCMEIKNGAVQGLISEGAYWSPPVTGSDTKLIWAVIKHKKYCVLFNNVTSMTSVLYMNNGSDQFLGIRGKFCVLVSVCKCENEKGQGGKSFPKFLLRNH